MNFLVTSANNYGNTGDDVCAYVSKWLIKKSIRGAKVIVTSPPFNQDLADWADVVVLGGGGIIYDHIKQNVDNYVQYLEYAKKNGKKRVLLGVGTQGINTAYGKRKYREALAGADLITVRSNKDVDALEKIGVKDVHLTQDLGFLSDKLVRMKRIHNFNKKQKRLGLITFDMKFLEMPEQASFFGKEAVEGGKHYMDVLEKNIPNLKEKYEITLIVQSADDIELAQRLAGNYGLKLIPYKGISDFSRTFNAIRKQDVIVTSRFHGLIFSMLNRRPVISIGFDGHKQDKLVLDHVKSLSDNVVAIENQDAVSNVFEERLFNPQGISSVSTEELNLLQAKADENSRLLKEKLL